MTKLITIDYYEYIELVKTKEIYNRDKEELSGMILVEPTIYDELISNKNKLDKIHEEVSSWCNRANCLTNCKEEDCTLYMIERIIDPGKVGEE